MSHRTDVLVVGAGMAGLMAANALQAAGRQVLVLDKGRGVGGRLATRRIGPGRADHGAQFFTVRAPGFLRYVDQWLTQGLVFEWSRGWSNGSQSEGPSDGHPRYAVRNGMTALPKYLADGLPVRTDIQVVAVQPGSSGWVTTDIAGNEYESRGLLLTPPVPQTLALLAAGDTTLAPAEADALAAIRYAPCLCGLFWLNGRSHLPAPGALQRPHAPISWIADNMRKGISPEAIVITVHGGPAFSEAHYDDPDEQVLDLLLAALRPHLDARTMVQERQLHRWRYALPLDFYPARTLRASGLPPLAIAGDAFSEPRVEGAALSGRGAAAALG